MTTTATATHSVPDATYLLFGQAMPALDAEDRFDIVDTLHDGEFGLALSVLVRAIDEQAVPVDHALLVEARKMVHSQGLPT